MHHIDDSNLFFDLMNNVNGFQTKSNNQSDIEQFLVSETNLVLVHPFWTETETFHFISFQTTSGSQWCSLVSVSAILLLLLMSSQLTTSLISFTTDVQKTNSTVG